jgi:uncharacterized membrane protein YqgA involved in biofilm formation
MILLGTIVNSLAIIGGGMVGLLVVSSLKAN